MQRLGNGQLLALAHLRDVLVVEDGVEHVDALLRADDVGTDGGRLFRFVGLDSHALHQLVNLPLESRLAPPAPPQAATDDSQ